MTARGGVSGGGPEPGTGAGVDLETDLETDLDDARGTAPGSRPPPPSRRRLGALVAVVVVALVAALVVADRTRRARASEVLLEAVRGELVSARGPAEGGGAVLASLEVELRNAGTTEVTLVAVSADGAGSALTDDLRGSGSESLGLERGLLLAPGAARGVVLTGAVVCPDAGADVGPAGLVVEALAADGTPRTVEVAGPVDTAWRSALGAACALGPGDAFPNDQRPLFADGPGRAAVVPALDRARVPGRARGRARGSVP